MNFINDCKSDKDMLGYEPYIKSFEYLLQNENILMSLPIVFGIHGKWGVGKSTFMELIQLKLNNSEKYYTMVINPWEYANQYNFVSVFVAELYRTIQKDLCNEEKGKEDSLLYFFKTICRPLKVSSDIAGFKAEYDFEKLTFDSQKELVEKYITENYEIKETIHTILDYEMFDRKKLIVFIDDLDRCPEDKVLEVIESIKLILNSKNCIFFLGCDKEYLESALSVKYKEFISFLKSNENEDENIFKKFAAEYLEKIIQIPFYIPSLNEDAVNNYIFELLNPCTNEGDNNQSVINEAEENLYEKFRSIINTNLLSKLFMEINFNPRRIKRILNITFLNYLFLKFKNMDNNFRKVDLDLLLLLGIIRDEYSMYYKKKLISEMLCRRTFENMHDYLKNEKKKDHQNSNMDLGDEDKKVIGLFSIFFESLKIKNKNDLSDLLLNIGTILTISRTTTSEKYDGSYWGEIGEIKSKTGTNKTLKSFLNRVKENSNVTDFLLWFFGDIYNKEDFYLGIQKNIQFYKNSNENHYENFLIKILYDDDSENLYIKFENGKYESKLDYKEKFIDLKNYDSIARQLTIFKTDTEKHINIVKEKLYELLISE